MGRSLNVNHVFNSDKLTKAQFKKKFTDMMKAKGYTSAKIDDAELCYELVFSADMSWVTLLSEESDDAKNKAAYIAKDLDMNVLSIELVDSDFAELTLFGKNGVPADTMFLGAPYFDEYPEPSPLKWQTMLGIDWSKVQEIQQGDYTFAEDALCSFGEIIGCDNMLTEFGEGGDNAVRVYFKKGAEKKLTLNSAFKEVFGPELEKQGFKLIKGLQSFYARIINDEIVQFICCDKCNSGLNETKGFCILYDIATVYRKTLDIKHFKDYFLNGFNSLFQTYKEAYPFDYSKEISNKLQCTEYFSSDNESLISGLKFNLEWTKKVLFPIYDRIVDIQSVISHYETRGRRIEITTENNLNNTDRLNYFCWNEDMLFTISDYKGDFTEFITSKEEFERKNDIIRANGGRIHPKNTYDNYYNVALECAEERRKKRDNIINNSELHRKVLLECDMRKKQNIDILKSYGL